MNRHHHARAAGWLAAGALLATALIAPATVSAATPTVDPHHDDGGNCTSSLFAWNVSNGSNAYPMLTVSVHAKSSVPQGCTFSFSLNSYTTEGPTWATSGTQALYDHASITLSAAKTSDTLTVEQPSCFGQTDFYTGTTKYDGQDGQLPHYPNIVTPYGLLAYSNGGAQCETTTTTSTTSSETTSGTTSTETTTETSTTSDETTTSDTTTSDTTTTDTTTSDTTSSDTTSSDTTSSDTTTSDTTSSDTTSSDTTSSDTTTSDTTSSTTTDGTTSSTTSSETTGSSTTSTSTPSGSVAGETGTPQVTPPSTDTVAQRGTAGTGSWMLVLALGALASLAVLVVTPARKRK